MKWIKKCRIWSHHSYPRKERNVQIVDVEARRRRWWLWLPLAVLGIRVAMSFLHFSHDTRTDTSNTKRMKWEKKCVKYIFGASALVPQKRLLCICLVEPVGLVRWLCVVLAGRKWRSYIQTIIILWDFHVCIGITSHVHFDYACEWASEYVSWSRSDCSYTCDISIAVSILHFSSSIYEYNTVQCSHSRQRTLR